MPRGRVDDRLLALWAFINQFLTAEYAKGLMFGGVCEVPARWAKLVSFFFDSVGG
jgi:hypothetical protein